MIDIAIAEDGAGAIILGSGALAGRAAVLGIGRGVPVIDSIEARSARRSLGRTFAKIGGP